MELSFFSTRIISSEQDMRLVYQIRKEVFTLEQHIPEDMDLDEGDQHAIHVLALDGVMDIGTGRIVLMPENQGHLSRIAVRMPYRGKGVGQRIIQELETQAAQHQVHFLYLYPHHYLESFYAKLGYRRVIGESEAGRHRLIKMVKDL